MEACRSQDAVIILVACYAQAARRPLLQDGNGMLLTVRAVVHVGCTLHSSSQWKCLLQAPA